MPLTIDPALFAHFANTFEIYGRFEPGIASYDPERRAVSGQFAPLCRACSDVRLDAAPALVLIRATEEYPTPLPPRTAIVITASFDGLAVETGVFVRPAKWSEVVRVESWPDQEAITDFEVQPSAALRLLQLSLTKRGLFRSLNATRVSFPADRVLTVSTLDAISEDVRLTSADAGVTELTERLEAVSHKLHQSLLTETVGIKK